MVTDEPRASTSRMDDIRQWLAVVLMPIIVAATGGLISWQINNTNEQNAAKMNQISEQNARDLERANREIRVMELVVGQLTDPNEKTRERGVHSFHLFVLFVPSLSAREQEILRAIGGQPGQAENVVNAVANQLGIQQRPSGPLTSESAETLYYRGMSLRHNNKRESIKVFGQYLANEAKQATPSKDYPQGRTAWVALLLAYDDAYVTERETNQSAKKDLLDDACFALFRSEQRRPEGFEKPFSVTTSDTRSRVEKLRKGARLPPCPQYF